jgi:hypothetical protein
MLTREEIENMPAGEQMDIAIAEHVLGHVWVHNKRYGCLLSSDHAMAAIAEGLVKAGKHPEHEASCCISPLDRYSNVVEAAWLVTDFLLAKGWHYTVASSYVTGTLAQLKGVGVDKLYQARADTAPLAICRAALLTVANPAPSPSPLPPTEKEPA